MVHQKKIIRIKNKKKKKQKKIMVKKPAKIVFLIKKIIKALLHTVPQDQNQA